MLDKLPDTIILDLLHDVPQLRFTSKRLYALSEYRIRTRLLSCFNHSDDQVDAFAQDIRENLDVESWEIIEGLATRDYWFFGPEHVVETDRYPGRSSEQRKGYYAVNGEPWGLCVVHWANKHLQYRTSLRAGVYDVYLDVSTPSLRELSKTRLTFLGGSTVTPHFRSTPPAFSLESQIESADLESNGVHHYEKTADYSSQMFDFDARARYLKEDLYFNSNASLLVGSLEVQPTKDNEWVEIGLRIESIDWSEPLTGVIFNYMSFKKQDQIGSVDKEWVLQPPQPLTATPTYALSLVYKRANERKRRWTLGAFSCTDLANKYPGWAEYPSLAC